MRVTAAARLATAVLLALAGATAAVFTTQAAHAQFPGSNGKIYFYAFGGNFTEEIFAVNPDGSGLTQLTDNTISDRLPVPSPDGTKILFISNRGGNTDWWVMNSDGSGPTQVTTTGVFDIPATWTPAGQIIYSDTSHTLTRINADGTGQTSLGRIGFGPSVSPDGTRIAFADSTSHISVTSADGRFVTTFADAETGLPPDWSPDGTKLVFRNTAGAIQTIASNGSNLTTVLAPPAMADYASPFWSPDGTKIVYTAGPYPFSIVTVNADGSGATTIYQSPNLYRATGWGPGPAGADVSVSTVDSSDPVALGDSYSYTTTVTNNGPAAASNVTASITLSGVSGTIVSATTSQGSCTVGAPTVTCPLGSLANAATATITIAVEPNTTGTITATATVAATEADPNSANNTAVQATTVNNGHGCTIIGTPGDDTLNGTNGADVICGLGGNDTINGGNGNDVIYGGTGDDTITGGNGDDYIYGQDGNDTLNGGNGNDHIYGGAGDDRTYGEDLLEGVFGLIFDNGNDYIDGGPGNDILDGQNGDDTLIDHDGTDTLKGSNGADHIDVGDGAGGDTADGGNGTDTCTTDPGDTRISC